MHGNVSLILLFPMLKTWKGSHLCRELGTFPSNILLLRSKVLKLQFSVNVSGIMPLSLFLPIFNTSRLAASIWNRQGGIFPFMELFDISRNRSLSRLHMEEGIDPVSLLLASEK